MALYFGGSEHPATAWFYDGVNADVSKFIFMFEKLATRHEQDEENAIKFGCVFEWAKFDS